MHTHSHESASHPVNGLIGSDTVEGTPVYRPSGDRIGTIERVMIDKISGRAAYAVMSFGGFLGIGDDHYPIPWPLLHYSEELGGYALDLSDSVLKAAPKFQDDDSWPYGDRGREAALYGYYGALPYW